MKKLRLIPDELAVDSFGLPEPEIRAGTVNAREWSLGGDGISCDRCVESEVCTQNPYDAECLSYAVQCPLTVDYGWTCAGSGCTQAPNYTCVAACH